MRALESRVARFTSAQARIKPEKPLRCALMKAYLNERFIRLAHGRARSFSPLNPTNTAAHTQKHAPPSPNPRPTARATQKKITLTSIILPLSLPVKLELFTHTSLASSSSLLPQSAASPSAMSTCQPLCGRAPP